MALLIPPGFVQAVYEFTRSGDTETMVVTCGHEIDTGSGANHEEAADDLFFAMAEEVMPNASTVTTLQGVTVYVGQDGGPPLVLTSSSVPVSGPNSAQLVPQNTAVLVRKRTDAAGRRGRGRFYFPEVGEESVDNVGNLSSASLASWQAAFDAWHEYLTAGVGARLYPPVILHRSEGIGAEPPPTPITRMVVDERVATQRRRLRP